MWSRRPAYRPCSLLLCWSRTWRELSQCRYQTHFPWKQEVRMKSIIKIRTCAQFPDPPRLTTPAKTPSTVRAPPLSPWTRCYQFNLISEILTRNVVLTKQVPFFLPPAQSMPWLNLLPFSFIFSMQSFFPWMRTWSGTSAKLCLLWAAFVICKKNRVEDKKPTSTSFNHSEAKWT